MQKEEVLKLMQLSWRDEDRIGRPGWVWPTWDSESRAKKNQERLTFFSEGAFDWTFVNLELVDFNLVNLEPLKGNCDPGHLDSEASNIEISGGPDFGRFWPFDICFCCTA